MLYYIHYYAVSFSDTEWEQEKDMVCIKPDPTVR